jgi:SNF2 family DNA or RNA helicase
LADEMGLGKTRSALTFIMENENEIKKILVICPKNAIDSAWKFELLQLKKQKKFKYEILLVEGNTN